jgi:transcriptional regulator with XRE-family HTH domain
MRLSGRCRVDVVVNGASVRHDPLASVKEMPMIVRKLRLQRGWTQEHLAEASGLSVRSIQRIERGRVPSMETLNALAAVFEVDRSLLDQGAAIMETTPLQDDEAEAIEYVKGLKEFYGHVFLYALFVVVFGLVFGFDQPFMFWGAIGWGLGVIANGLSAYEVITFGTPRWERRMIEKRLGRPLG